MKEVKGYEWCGLLLGRDLSQEKLDELLRNQDPNAGERYRQLVKEDDPFRVDDRTSSTKIQ